jgi:hypothetical protein
MDMKTLSLRCTAAMLLVFLSSNLRAQSSVIFGHPGYNAAYEIIPTNDGGFMVGGQSNDTVTGSLQYWVVKGSNKGEIAWDSLFGGDSRDFLWSIKPAFDGGALLAGYSNPQGSGLEAAVLFKIDSVGHTKKRIEVDYARADHAHWFAQRKQGGYFWAGHTDSEGDSTGEMILQKLDDNFNKVWEHTYRKNIGEHAHCGTLTSDGGCVLLGHTVIGGYEHFWANRIDSNGTLVWSKVFQSSSVFNDSPYGIVTTREGGFAMFGGSGNSQGTASTMWLVVVDSAGTKIVDKHFGPLAFAYSGLQTSDGGFMLVGYSSSATHGGYDVDVVKTDLKGAQQWQKKYGTTADDLGYAACEHKSQYIVAGQTYINGQSDLWLLYIDSTGAPVPYEGPTSPLAFTVDSNSLKYDVDNDTHVHGTIENLTADSLHITFKRTQTVSKSHFDFHTEIGASEFLTDTTTALIGFGPHEKKPFLEHVVAYPSITDSGTLCITLYPREGTGTTVERCIFLRPNLPSSVPLVTAMESKPSFSIYPNPIVGSSSAIIRSNDPKNMIGRVAIYDALGRLVWTMSGGNRTDVSWDGRSASGSLCSTGMYHIQITTPHGTYGLKLSRL